MTNYDIIIFDGNNIAHRARHVFHLSHNGKDVSVIYGFIKMMSSAIGKYHPKSVVVTWDYGVPDFRYDLVPTYKRRDHMSDPTWPDFLAQMDELHNIFLPNLGILSVKLGGCEADDLMHDICMLTDGLKLVISNDMDMVQLVAEDVHVLNKHDKLITADNFADIMEFYPKDYLFYRSMIGDGSDGIPGIEGIGHKTAIAIIKDIATNPEELIHYVDGNLLQDRKIRSYKKLKARILERGLEGFINAIKVMDLGNAVTGAGYAFKVKTDFWCIYDHYKIVSLLKNYAFLSLMHKNFHGLYENLINPREFMSGRTDIRIPIIPSSHKSPI